MKAANYDSSVKLFLRCALKPLFSPYVVKYHVIRVGYMKNVPFRPFFYFISLFLRGFETNERKNAFSITMLLKKESRQKDNNSNLMMVAFYRINIKQNVLTSPRTNQEDGLDKH